MSGKNPVVKMIIGIAAVIAVFAAAVVCGIYINYMEYLEIGEKFTDVFWVNFNANMLTFVVSIIIFFILIYVNLLVIRNNLLGIDSSFSYLKKGFWFVIFSFAASLAMAVLSIRRISSTIMPYLNSEFFGKGDPIFYKDIGYYVFQRPFYISVADVFLNFAAVMIFATVILYAVFYGRFDFYNMKNIVREKKILVHIIFLIMLFFLLKAVTYKFVGEDIIFNRNSDFVGADYVDLKVWLKFYNIVPVILIAVVAVTTFFTLRQKFKQAIVAVAVYPLIFVLTTVIASVVNTMVVAPNEMSVQNDYIQHNIDYTRSAYGLDNAIEQQYAVKNDLNEQKIMSNLATIDNIRINDFDQTVNILNQLQSLKTYYTFTDADVVTYTLDGEPTAVAVAAREINTDRLADSAKTYVNMKMRYTHGMGVAVNKINTVNENGQPDFIVKDIPVTSNYSELYVKEPRIYYGESNSDYVIVGTKDGESDDIEGNGYAYQGKGGIGLGFFNRLILSVRETDFMMLVSNQISGNSKILLNTNIIDRVKKVAPFLQYDSDPTIVIDKNGRLKWIIDAYTVTPYYPYSEYNGDFNYIRNSVKAVVDAYDGTTSFYIIDNNDPIIKSYADIYPNLFEKSAFPSDLSEHIRYPMDIFNIQASMLQKYHIKSAAEFYQNKGVWSISNEKSSESVTQAVKPYYNYMKVDGEAELVLMIPYTLSNKDNMISWMAVRCTGENYGQHIIYNFSQSENIAGTYQVENRIDSDDEISKDISLWESSGSSVIRGNMLVIPVDGNILYVEPLYISSGNEQSSLPQIARIVVSYNDRVVSETTLNGCLNKLFGVTRVEEPAADGSGDINSFIKKAIKSYTDAKEFSKEGNWEAFGKAMDELDNNINNLKNKLEADDNSNITADTSEGGN